MARSAVRVRSHRVHRRSIRPLFRSRPPTSSHRPLIFLPAHPRAVTPTSSVLSTPPPSPARRHRPVTAAAIASTIFKFDEFHMWKGRFVVDDHYRQKAHFQEKSQLNLPVETRVASPSLISSLSRASLYGGGSCWDPYPCPLHSLSLSLSLYLSPSLYLFSISIHSRAAAA